VRREGEGERTSVGVAVDGVAGATRMGVLHCPGSHGELLRRVTVAGCRARTEDTQELQQQ
jgi:hypothetical protein